MGLMNLYDYMPGSQYLFVIIAQLREGVIHDSDLENLSEEVRERIRTILSFDDK
jgi:cation transport regulator ChaC